MMGKKVFAIVYTLLIGIFMFAIPVLTTMSITLLWHPIIRVILCVIFGIEIISLLRIGYRTEFGEERKE